MFKTYFGNKNNIQILDFLADHVNYSFTLTEIMKNTSNNYITDSLKNLMLYGFVIGEGNKYKLNTKNDLIKAMLKFDFEQGKNEFDQVKEE